jgi:hypothetical protein
MISAQRLLMEGQRSTEERLGSSVVALTFEQCCQVLEI